MTTLTTPQFPDVHVQLSGRDGNIFAIIGRVHKALQSGGAPQTEIDRFVNEMMNAHSYHEALTIVMRWVNVS